MMVEFLGAAGVGKTYLSDRALEELQTRGVPARNFDLISINRIAPANLYSMLKALYVGMATVPKDVSRFAQAVQRIARYSIRRNISRKAEGIYVTSEGLFHRGISLQRGSRALTLLQIADVLVRQIAPSDLVVVVEDDAERIYQRRLERNRENDQFTKDSVRQDVEMVKASVAVMQHLQETRLPSLQILKIRADSNGNDDNVNRIVDLLCRHALAQKGFPVTAPHPGS